MWQSQKWVLVLVLGLDGAGDWKEVEGDGDDQRKVTTPKTSACAHFRVGWWLVGIKGWWWQPERGDNPENKHLLLVFRVEGGGGDQRQPQKWALVLVSGLGSWWALKGGEGDQREAATPKTSTRCLFSGLRMVVVTRERLQPRKWVLVLISGFNGWWWLVGIK